MATGNQREPHLVLVDSPDQEVYLLPEGKTRIGRSKENDVCVQETSVSRFHCYVHRQGAEVRIYDERSQNKTRVGDRDATGQALRDGDAIRMGRVRIIYRGPDAPLPPLRTRRALAARRRSAPMPAAPAIILAIVLGIGGIAGGALLVLRWNPGSGTEAGTAAVVPDPEAVSRAELMKYLEDANQRTRELEKRLSELLAQRPAPGQDAVAPAGSGEAAASSGDGALQEQIAAVQAELAGNQEDRDRVLERLRRLVSPESRNGEEEFLAPDVDPSGRGDTGSGRTGVTVVEKPPAERKPRPPSEVRALVARLIELFDDYANPEAGGKFLEPPLTELSMTTGRPTAEGLLKVHRHAQDLLADLDRNLDFLKQRNEELIRKARQLGSDEPGPPAAGGYGPPRANPEMEKNQRLLELSAKKIRILEDQRERLLSMRKAVLDAMARLTDPEATEYLVMRFNSESQVLLQLAIIEALKEARARHAVPALINTLSNRDPDLQAAARRALAAIAGADLGDKRQPWDEWWREFSRD